MSLTLRCVRSPNAISFSDAHLLKTKYDVPKVLDYVKERAGGDTPPTVSSIAVNWRGVVAPQMKEVIRQLGLTKGTTDLLAVRVLWGSSSVNANYMGTSGKGDVMTDVPPEPRDETGPN